jgi:hypothetical protein
VAGILERFKRDMERGNIESPATQANKNINSMCMYMYLLYLFKTGSGTFGSHG